MLPTPEQVAAEEAQEGPVNPAAEFLGVWQAKDDDGDVFNIIIMPEGKAVTNWFKGEAGSRGEFGDWTVEDGAIRLIYDSGWKDVLIKNDEGYLKLGYAPGITFNDQPSNQDMAEKVTGPVAEYIGVWYREDSLPKKPWYLALLSDRSARRSDNLEAAGKWELHDGGRVEITWADELATTLAPQKKDGTLTLMETTRPTSGHGQASYQGALQRVAKPMDSVAEPSAPPPQDAATDHRPESLDDVSLEPTAPAGS